MKFGISLCILATTAAISAASAKPVENVLFLISDDLKASVLGCYGDTITKTPNIDRLAKNAVVFDRAYCQGTVCAPSRLSFMLSRYKGGGTTNIGEHLQKHGFYSARAGKVYHMRVPGDIIAGTDGNDIASTWTESFNMPGKEAHTPGDYACLNLNIFTKDEENRQSTKMPHRMFVTVSYEGDGSDQPDHKAAGKIVDLLGKHKDERFFLVAGFVRPHYPMVQPKQYFDLYPWSDMKLPALPANDLDDMPRLAITNSRSAKNGIDRFPDNQKRMWAGYRASVTFMDEQVGRIMDELDRLNLRETTAIVFLSDHGYHLGEHTFWQKGNLHEEVTRVPLIISAPGMKAGRSDAIVELVDIFPTVAELTGTGIPKSVQGKSLVPILKDHKAGVKDGALSFTPGGTSLRSSKWTYTRYKDNSEELYDMVNDPDQFNNLARSAEHEATLTERAKALRTRLKAAGISATGKKR